MLITNMQQHDCLLQKQKRPLLRKITVNAALREVGLRGGGGGWVGGVVEVGAQHTMLPNYPHITQCKLT